MHTNSNTYIHLHTTTPEPQLWANRRGTHTYINKYIYITYMHAYILECIHPSAYCDVATLILCG